MIVCDSTPLIHLSRIGRLEILKHVFQKVIIPETVFKETVVRGKEKGFPDSTNIESQDWIVKRTLSREQASETERLLVSANIGLGETECIVLARAENISVLMDDSTAARVANTFGIQTYWTTSVILKAVSNNLLEKSEAKTILGDLVRTGYRLRPEILMKILKLLENRND